LATNDAKHARYSKYNVYLEAIFDNVFEGHVLRNRIIDKCRNN
jgi:hypothetical protein